MIKYIDVKPHAGGLTKIVAVVDESIDRVAKNAAEARLRPYELVLKPISKRRSLNANGYYWTLVDKIAGVLKTNSKDIHRQMLARYGVTDLDSDGKPLVFRAKADIDPMEFADRGIYVDAVDGYGGYVTYKVLKGSSRMDTKEFSNLLDGAISECKELGIEVLPEDELQRLFKIQEQEG